MGEKFVMSTVCGVVEKPKKTYLITDMDGNKEIARLSQEAYDLLEWVTDNLNIYLDMEELSEAEIPEF